MYCAIDWNAVRSHNYQEEILSEVTRQVTHLLTNTGTIPLDDCFLNRGSGGQVFIREMTTRQNNDNFATEQRGTFKIRLLRHQDGSTPKPGDVFQWVHSQKNSYVDRVGKRRPMNTQEAARMLKRCRVDGDENDINIWRVKTLDKDNCFECSFHDAMACLTNFSQHSIYPENNGDGDDPSVWYWICEQVLPEEPKPEPKSRKK